MIHENPAYNKLGEQLGDFFIFDHNTQIAAASGNLLIFIAFNFMVADDLPRLGYLTFLDSIMLIGFVISITGLMLALYFKRLEGQGREEFAMRLERHTLIIAPAIVIIVFSVSIGYFFFII